jgi:hypothetical protein
MVLEAGSIFWFPIESEREREKERERERMPWFPGT